MECPTPLIPPLVWDIVKIVLTAMVTIAGTLLVQRQQQLCGRADECIAHLDKCALAAAQSIRKLQNGVTDSEAIDEMTSARDELGRDLVRRFDGKPSWNAIEIAVTDLDMALGAADPTSRAPATAATGAAALAALQAQQHEMRRQIVRAARKSPGYRIWGKHSR